jgi:hypothetical protein
MALLGNVGYRHPARADSDIHEKLGRFRPLTAMDHDPMPPRWYSLAVSTP